MQRSIRCLIVDLPLFLTRSLTVQRVNIPIQVHVELLNDVWLLMLNYCILGSFLYHSDCCPAIEVICLLVLSSKLLNLLSNLQGSSCLTQMLASKTIQWVVTFTCRPLLNGLSPSVEWIEDEGVFYWGIIVIWTVLGQNDRGQNGTDKMVWTKWYTDKMVSAKMVWSK